MSDTPQPPVAQQKTLLVVMAHAGANAMVQTLWPWYERAECDILGIGRIGSRWPSSPRLIGFRDEGQDVYNDGTSQLTRFLNVLDFVTANPDQSPYSDFLICEWDTIFTKPAVYQDHGFIGTLAGYGAEPFRGSIFYHGPWWMKRAWAEWVLVFGRRMLKAGLTEQGFLDRWIGLMADLYSIPIHDLGGYSRNSLDRPEYIEQGRAAIKAGAWAIHGCKTPGQLAQLTEGL